MTASAENVALGGLLLRCAQQDPSALAQFYDRTSSWVYTLIRPLTTSRAMADDVMVAVYAKVWRSSANWAGLSCSPLAWTTSLAFEASRSASLQAS